MTVCTAWPRLMNPDMAEAYVGGEKVMADLIAKKLLKARTQGKGLTRYDRHDLDAALDAWKGFSE